MLQHSRARKVGVGAAALILTIVVAAFVLGSGGPQPESAGTAVLGRPTGSATGLPSHAPATQFGQSAGNGGSDNAAAGTAGAAAPVAAPAPPAARDVGTSTVLAADAGLTATRVVKTGSLSLAVPKGQVQITISKLGRLTRQLGGYISGSQTDNVSGTPSGELTMRIPVSRFDSAVAAAARLGHETALSTSAHDITGKYVDLTARAAALKSTRRTYLTILSKATTIGETLSVQQRVDDVQQQIEQLQGQLKVLRNQSADGTLTVDVSENGSPAAAPHHSGGIGNAWHTSVSRFSRGIDVIVSILGPLLLMLILLGLAGVIIRFATRRTRRATT